MGHLIIFADQFSCRMKKIIFVLLALLSILPVLCQKTKPRVSYSVGSWDVQIVSFDHLYPVYLADPQGVRFEVSARNILYDDMDFQDPANQAKGYKGRKLINPAARFSFLKFSPKSNPRLGISLDLGAIAPVILRSGNHDLISLDGIGYYGIAAHPTEWLSLHFIKHHISAHVGDEFSSGMVSSPVDFDPNFTPMPVLDDFVAAAAFRPLWFLKMPQWDILQLYGDFGFFYPGKDMMGIRQNKPHPEAWFSFQGGAELEYYFANIKLGGLYTAINVSAYQMNAYAPNISITGGYILPQERDLRRFRLGLNYYNGRSLSNQYFNRKERFIAIYFGFDI